MKKRKLRKASKHFHTMKTSDLAEATAAYGREMIVDEFKTLSKSARDCWERAQRKPGRPRRGKGVKVISVSVEQNLLQRSDKLARSLGVSRARLIERGLRVVLASDGK
jgi:hypothetical protein